MSFRSNWPADLYRCFDDDDRLLYIGVTGSIKKRLMQHRQKSRWFPAVAKVTTERFTTRDAAFAAERAAIDAENPLHNVRRDFLPPLPPVVAHAGSPAPTDVEAAR